jgi:pilus assembly protein CpaE
MALWDFFAKQDYHALRHYRFFSFQLAETKETWRFHLLAGSPDPESSNRLKVGRIRDIVAALKPFYDYVLVDIGRSLSKITLPLIQNADLVTMVVSTDLSAVSMTRTLLDYLQNKGVNADSIYTLLNRAVGLEGLSKAEVEKILEIQINSMLPYLGGNFTFTNNQHQPFTVKFPNDTATLIFKEIAKETSSLARKLREE